jgi:hypothetical protein
MGVSCVCMGCWWTVFWVCSYRLSSYWLLSTGRKMLRNMINISLKWLLKMDLNSPHCSNYWDYWKFRIDLNPKKLKFILILNAFEFLYAWSIVARKILLIPICILASFFLKRIHTSPSTAINGLTDSNIEERFSIACTSPDQNTTSPPI